jgi:hypothetical protein
MVALQAWLAWLGSRSTNFARIGNISIFLSHAQVLETCACARSRNYIIKSADADMTVQR